MADAADWREDPYRVKQWVLNVMRQCSKLGLSEKAFQEHIAQRVEAQRIPPDVFRAAVQLACLEIAAEAAFRRLDGDP